jgi:hypothetical protein
MCAALRFTQRKNSPSGIRTTGLRAEKRSVLGRARRMGRLEASIPHEKRGTSRATSVYTFSANNPPERRHTNAGNEALLGSKLCQPKT